MRQKVRHKQNILFGVLNFLFAFLVILSGCSRKPQETLTLAEIAAQLAEPDAIARLDLPDTEFVSSTDPACKNNDFNQYLRPGPKGWWVLTDLKGPGYVSRFWFTGGDPSHKVRLFFDNEKKPRIDTAISEFCGGMEPFVPPLAAYENYCYYNYVPLTYKKRLVVMVEEGATREHGWPRLFYQINYSALPGSLTTSSLTLPLTTKEQSALKALADIWTNRSPLVASISAETNSILKTEAEILPQTTVTLLEVPGPGIVRNLELTPDFEKLPDVLAQEKLLRDIVLRIYWDDHPEPSVLAPVGDFGGSVWLPARFQSLFFGMSNSTWSIRFPMPFAEKARVELFNQTDFPVTFQACLKFKALPQKPDYGYFHAVWRRSNETDVGSPHVVLDTQGKGRFVGCLLSAVSLDHTFWLLEGNEYMWLDGEMKPSWCGTGLEDYFTGGWYYQNTLARPLHGLLLKNFFRTVQYRIHLPEAVNFKDSFRMIFERGPEDQSHGVIETLAWYYLDRPCSTGCELPEPAKRRTPPNPFAQATVMQQICTYERFKDYWGTRQFIDYFLAACPDFALAGVLRLRQAACLEYQEGQSEAISAISKLLETTDEMVLEQARVLLSFYENKNAAILGFNANMPSRVFLNGEIILDAIAPDKLAFKLISLPPGKYVLAIQSTYQPYPDWVQLYLKTHLGSVYTTPDWLHAVNPGGFWWNLDYDDSLWVPVGGTGCKGPPEEPYIMMEPNAFVNMQSQAIGLRPSIDWETKKGTAVYRHVFEITASGIK